MERKILSLIIFVSIFLTSCNSTIYFTQEMRNNIDENNLKIEDVQFYVSQKLILKRNLSSDEIKIARGEIKFENGQFVEEIIIPKNTPGIAVDLDIDWVDIVFEQGFNRDLKFVLNSDDNYQITALEWNSNYGKVKYDTTFYYLVPGSDKALLKVKKEDIFNFQKNKRVVKGINIDK